MNHQSGDRTRLGEVWLRLLLEPLQQRFQDAMERLCCHDSHIDGVQRIADVVLFLAGLALRFWLGAGLAWFLYDRISHINQST